MVDSAGVYVDVFAQIFHAHCRTFDVPSRISAAPWTVPRQSLVFEFALRDPEYEIGRVALVFIDDDDIPFSCSGFQFVKV